MLGDRCIRAGQVRGGFGRELLGPDELTPLRGPDRRGRALDRRAGRTERHLAGAVLLREHVAHRRPDPRDLVGPVHGRRHS